MKQQTNKIIIGCFLILGTMLAGYITADGINELYFRKTTWMYREGFFYKLPFILVTLDFIYLTITGLISCISFFRRGKLWKSLTKIILVNIALFFVFGDCTMCCFRFFGLESFIYIIITIIVFLLLWRLHLLVKNTDQN